MRCESRRPTAASTNRGVSKKAALFAGLANRRRSSRSRFLRGNPNAEPVLQFEDMDIGKRRAIVDERVSLVSTGDFLRELEAAGFIQSTDSILDQAAAQGRNVEKKAGGDSTTRVRLREQLVQRRDASGLEQ